MARLIELVVHLNITRKGENMLSNRKEVFQTSLVNLFCYCTTKYKIYLLDIHYNYSYPNMNKWYPRKK